MESQSSAPRPTFSARVGMAFRMLFSADFASEVATALTAERARVERTAPLKAPSPSVPPERLHASGLFVLSALQREGRLIDFLQQDVANFGDEEVGAAARVVHSGCRKVLKQYLALEPIAQVGEGETMAVPAGFDAAQIRLTGNVTGQPPFKGTLKHHGWIANEVRLPALSDSMDPRVLAPAEVELA